MKNQCVIVSIFLSSILLTGLVAMMGSLLLSLLTISFLFVRDIKIRDVL